MPTLELNLNDSDYSALAHTAQQQNQPIEVIAQAVLTGFLGMPRRNLKPTPRSQATAPGALRRAKIHIEAEAWQNLPAVVRLNYGNDFVAVYNGQVVDHDADRLVLHRRVREQFGREPVLITPANSPSPREFRLRSPRLERVP